MADYRPRIGITMRLDIPTDRFYLSRHYSEAVEAAGGVPSHLSLIPNSSYIASALDGLDGILLPGSASDVDPLLYDSEPHHALGDVHSLKDQTDLLVLEELEARRMPVLGICYGMQILNVHRGGKLIQDIVSQIPEAIKHQQGSPRDRPSHRVKLLAGSLLSSLATTDRALVNSHHHQAVETVGRDLVATAWTSDGLVEALEDPRPDRFVVAVQWHPELGWRQDNFAQSLFTRFVNESREFARRRMEILAETHRS
jgi:putative glutamine amidotransferase